MGNIVNKLVRRSLRPFKNFAVEARTDRILEKEKPIPAPWHPSTQEKINNLIKNRPELFEDQDTKNESLDKRLQEIYVTSKDEPTLLNNVNKPLPKERKNVDPPEFGYTEPAKVSKGKMTIQQALLFIGRHHQDPVAHTAFSLAKEYTIHPKVAENILKHFKTFELYQPPNAKVQIQVKDYITFKSLPSPQETKQKLIDEAKS